MAANTVKLEAKKRTKKGRRHTAKLKAEGRIPGILYGAGIESTMVSVESLAFRRAFEKAGEGQILHLDVEGTEHPVLIKDLGYHPQFEEPAHVDFWRLDLSKEIIAPVQIVFEGFSPAVKGDGGTLVKVLTELEVKALPTALPEHFVVDLSKLINFDSSISIADIVIPEGVTLMHELTETVATVEAPRTDEEMAALESAVETDVTKVEGVVKDEPVEGEATEENDKKEGGNKEVKKEKKEEKSDEKN